MSKRTLSDGDVEAIALAVDKHASCSVFTDRETAGLKIMARVLGLAEKSVITATAISVVGLFAAAFGYGIVVLFKLATTKVWP